MTDDQEPVKLEPPTFGSISDERQWGWGEELEVCRDFITSTGLDAELVAFAREVADQERDQNLTERLNLWPLEDLLSIAEAMPPYIPQDKASVIGWLVTFQRATVEKELDL